MYNQCVVHNKTVACECSSYSVALGLKINESLTRLCNSLALFTTLIYWLPIYHLLSQLSPPLLSVMIVNAILEETLI